MMMSHSCWLEGEEDGSEGSMQYRFSWLEGEQYSTSQQKFSLFEFHEKLLKTLVTHVRNAAIHDPNLESPDQIKLTSMKSNCNSIMMMFLSLHLSNAFNPRVEWKKNSLYEYLSFHHRLAIITRSRERERCMKALVTLQRSRNIFIYEFKSDINGEHWVMNL
jgi:hypothetical protein